MPWVRARGESHFAADRDEAALCPVLELVNGASLRGRLARFLSGLPVQSTDCVSRQYTRKTTQEQHQDQQEEEEEG